MIRQTLSNEETSIKSICKFKNTYLIWLWFMVIGFEYFFIQYNLDILSVYWRILHLKVEVSYFFVKKSIKKFLKSLYVLLCIRLANTRLLIWLFVLKVLKRKKFYYPIKYSIMNVQFCISKIEYTEYINFNLDLLC